MTPEEIAKIVEDELLKRQPAIHDESLQAAELCYTAIEAALSPKRGERPHDLMWTGLSPRERILIGSILFTVITKIYASAIAAATATKFMETDK